MEDFAHSGQSLCLHQWKPYVYPYGIRLRVWKCLNCRVYGFTTNKGMVASPRAELPVAK